MPPRKQKKSISVSSYEAISSFPAPPTMVPTKTDDGSRTPPQRSPSKQSLGITQAQKQALIDNLQLEITERARKLRAQYALQAQGLRARLEMRVNRIPTALRKRNIQDLVDEHAARMNPKPAPAIIIRDAETRQIQEAPVERKLKRTSEHFVLEDDDKENMPDDASRELANPKKRTKTVTTANTKAARTASRKVQPSTVLSPKSHNSRTLPRSPIKSFSPEKPMLAVPRAASPIKPVVTQATATSKPPSRAPSRQTKRPAAAAVATESEGRDSETSIASAGTTIITKPAAKRAPAAKKPAPKAPAATTAAAKRAAAAKKEVAAPVPASSGRTLRKRG